MDIHHINWFGDFWTINIRMVFRTSSNLRMICERCSCRTWQDPRFPSRDSPLWRVNHFSNGGMEPAKSKTGDLPSLDAKVVVLFFFERYFYPETWGNVWIPTLDKLRDSHFFFKVWNGAFPKIHQRPGKGGQFNLNWESLVRFPWVFAGKGGEIEATRMTRHARILPPIFFWGDQVFDAKKVWCSFEGFAGNKCM